MIRKRVTATAMAALALAGAVAIGGCAENGGGTGGGSVRTPSVTSTPTGPSSGWGPQVWRSEGGSTMMGGASGSWAPGMMGAGMTGNWWLAGNGERVQTLGQARQRATAFADRLGLTVGEIMQFSRNFYAELRSADGRPATEALVNPADGAAQIEYGPAMMWNTVYGMHYGSRSAVRVSAARAQSIAQQWLQTHGSAQTAVEPESYPGYYTLHTRQSGKITGMLSVNSSTGQVWYHSWHGSYIATSQR
ncbi:hypothetical protein [Streptomyces sp. NPDC002265]|uniref:hypothetical protein n=1 Tax=Streptomyces sp. NPDC002265 TaxID=3154415 RepID=UPI0033184705